MARAAVRAELSPTTLQYSNVELVRLTHIGGLEIHMKSQTDPFDVANNEIIDFDLVLKEKYDLSTFAVRVGCGGCVHSVDPVKTDPIKLTGYEPGDLEPFTQTSYYSVFKKEDRKFATGVLSTCTENHWSIRITDFHNRSDSSVLVWGGVVGLKEQFSFVELLSFPMFVLSNHGSSWSNLAFTAPLSFLILAPLLIFIVRWFLSMFGLPYVALNLELLVDASWRPFVSGEFAVREVLYEIALHAFVGTQIEMFIHLCVAQAGIPLGYGFWVGLFAVIGFANILPIFQVLSAWSALQFELTRPDDKRNFFCCKCYLLCSNRKIWAPIEIITGLSYFLLFGSGMFLGPAAIVLAGILSVFESRRGHAYTHATRETPPRDTTYRFPLPLRNSNFKPHLLE